MRSAVMLEVVILNATYAGAASLTPVLGEGRYHPGAQLTMFGSLRLTPAIVIKTGSSSAWRLIRRSTSTPTPRRSITSSLRP
jgi:hypothetical protein